MTSELERRLSEATGGSRELDALLFEACGWLVNPKNREYGKQQDESHYRFLHRVTESIDAAVALAEGIAHVHGRKLICFFCAGGQLMPHNADETDPDYHPLAKIDNSVTVGWMSHVAFFKPYTGSETHGPAGYSRGPNAALAICLALVRALATNPQPEKEPTNG